MEVLVSCRGATQTESQPKPRPRLYGLWGLECLWSVPVALRLTLRFTELSAWTEPSCRGLQV